MDYPRTGFATPDWSTGISDSREAYRLLFLLTLDSTYYFISRKVLQQDKASGLLFYLIITATAKALIYFDKTL